MGRPTDDKKESSIILRVNSDLKRELEGKAQEDGVTLSGYLRDKLKGIVIHNENNFVIHNSEVNVIQNEPSEYETVLDGISIEDLNDLSIMAVLSGGTLADLLRDLQDKLNSGLITLTDGKMEINECPFDYSRFMDACHDKNVDPQKMIDTAAQRIAGMGL